MQVDVGDFDDPRVVELLAFHATTARAQTAPGSAHALDLTALRSPDVHLWTIRDGEALLGVGALKRHSRDHGEVKSMHTVEAARNRGVGTELLGHIIATARAMGLTRLCLETGSWPYFRPARMFYRSNGFVECAPFGDYVEDPNSVFMTLDLQR